MSNKIFLDSSILVEAYKGSKKELLIAIARPADINLFISSIVLSEFYFHFVAYEANTSPMTAKEKGEVANIFSSKNPESLMAEFIMIDGDESTPEMAANLMGTYNLLPNDALILTICKLHQIPALASYDPDFVNVCKGENITLLSSVEDFKKFRNRNA